MCISLYYASVFVFYKQVSEYIAKIKTFIAEVDKCLAKKEPSSVDVTELIEQSTEFDLDLPQITTLHHVCCLLFCSEELLYL